MNNEKFLDLLSKVAHWEIPDVTTGGNPKKGPGRKSAEEKFQEQHEEVFLDMFNGKNPTLHPVITKVKVASCLCEDCGKFCENGRKKDLSQYHTNRPHWREKCLTCGMGQNPETGQFDLTKERFNPVWSNWLRKTSDKPYVYKKKSPTNTSDDFDSDK